MRTNAHKTYKDIDVMRKTLILGTALCLITGAAYAGGGNHEQPYSQPMTPGSNNTALAGAAAAAASRSDATSSATAHGGNATGGNASATGGRGGRGGNASNGGQSQSTSYSGGNYSAHGNTPDVILGSVSGGNPCGLGAGAGGSGPGASGVLSMMWEGSGCQRLEDAKLLHNLGFDHVSVKDRLCEGGSWLSENHFKRTFWNAGDPCPSDREDFAKARRAQGYYQRQDGAWVR